MALIEVQSATTITANIATVQSNVDVISNDVSSVSGEAASFAPPVGTIIGLHKSMTGVPALPGTWVECSGQVINDSNSPMNGETVPDLNGDARFLRGSSTSGTEEADMFEDHTHTHSYIVGQGNGAGSWGMAAGGSDLATITSIGSEGGAETRPINMSVIWIMRIK